VVRRALSNIQKRRLAQRGHRWVQTIKRINGTGNLLSGDEAAAKYAEAMDSLHLLALALEHLDSCIKILNEAGVQFEGDSAFRAAWETISKLRDAREHEEEYIAGPGRFPDNVGPNWAANGYFESATFIWGTDGIDSVSFMGKVYTLRPAITAALALEEALSALWNPPVV